jgi:hypothetical protein
MQTSIAAEALGYLLAVRAGRSPNAADKESYRRRLDRVLDSQPLNVADVAGDKENWSQAAADAYNGVKHAHLSLPPPPLPTLFALTLTMVLRANLLCVLGVDRDLVAKLAEHQGWWGLRKAYDSVANWPSRQGDEN